MRPSVLTHYSLSNANTMALSCIASQAVVLRDERELEHLPNNLPLFILSGGSNVLLPEALHATVLLPRFRGVRIVKEDEDSIILDVMGGENWHSLVNYCTHKGWYGIENLALIPGLVGAAPVQNIGAYGVQLDEVLVGAKVYDLGHNSWHFFDKKACKFGYRDSIFKRDTRQLLITCIRIELHKDPTKINVSYGDLAQYAQEWATMDMLEVPTPLQVMKAVVAIRQSKLPDPKVLPNCGSFFQNPIISKAQFDRLKVNHPTMPSYPVDDINVKVPAGWLIDRAGLKGGGVAPILTHKNQALVLTNHAPQLATQKNIKASQDFIVKTVSDLFGIRLVREPVWVGEYGDIGGHQVMI